MKKIFKSFTKGFLFIIPLLLAGVGVLLFLQAHTGPHVPTSRVPEQTANSLTSSAADAVSDTLSDSADANANADISDFDTADSDTVDSDAVDSTAGNSDSSSSTVTLSFAGDILFTENTLSRYDSSGLSSLVSDELLSTMTGSDLLMFNEEFPFSTRGEAAADKQYTFRVDPAYVRIFKELGIDLVTVANNHALDFGTDAFLDSLSTLDDAGIARVGGGRDLAEASAPVIRTIGDYTIGFLGASRVLPVSSWAAGASHPGMFSTYDPTLLNAAITELKASCDYVVVYVHWGIEKDEYPQDYQRQLAYAYIDAGADMVIGAHPHVLQGFEYYKGRPIAYSLGNFLFSNSSNSTVLYQITIAADGTLQPRVLPCVRSNGQMQLSGSPANACDYLTSLSYGVSIDSEGWLHDSSAGQ